MVTVDKFGVLVDSEYSCRRQVFLPLKTVDQIKDLRELAQDKIYEATGREVIIPSGMVIADAIDGLHKATFTKTEQEV